MKEILRTASRNEAERLRIFLGQHGIDAVLENSALDEVSPAAEAEPAPNRVSVADDQETVVQVLLDEFRDLYHDCMAEEWTVDEPTQAPIAGERSSAKRSIPWLTGVFCLTASAVTIGYLRDPGADSISRWGWRDALEVAEGSYWSLFSSVLLHESYTHLALNLFGIVILGTAIERHFGHRSWLALFSVAALVGGSAELAALGQLGIGGSGLLYLLLGFALVSSTRRRLLPWWLLVPLSMWLLYGTIFDAAGVFDHYLSGRPLDPVGRHAHLVGLLMGMLMALAFVIGWRKWWTRTAIAAALVGALVPLCGSPWLPQWLIAKADREFGRGNLPAALDLYSSAIRRSPSPAAAFVYHGWILVVDGRFEEAERDFDEALRLDRTTPGAHASKAMLRILRSDLEAAKFEANHELHDAGASGLGYTVRSYVHSGIQEFDNAKRDLDLAVAREPQVAIHQINRSLCHLEQCEFSAALRDIEGAIALDPEDGDALLARGLCRIELAALHQARNDLEQALRLLTLRAQQRPRDVWAHTSLSAIQEALFEVDPSPHHLAEASRHAEMALQIAPQFWYTWRLRGAVELHSGNYANSERDLSRSLELNPHDAWSHCFRGWSYHHLARSEDALRDLDRALILHPRLAYALCGRALVKQSRGESLAAIDDVNRAIELNPQLAKAYHLRGKARIDLGEAEAGRIDLERALKLDPNVAKSKRTSDAVLP